MRKLLCSFKISYFGRKKHTTWAETWHSSVFTAPGVPVWSEVNTHCQTVTSMCKERKTFFERPPSSQIWKPVRRSTGKTRCWCVRRKHWKSQGSGGKSLGGVWLLRCELEGQIRPGSAGDGEGLAICYQNVLGDGQLFLIISSIMNY